MPVPLSRPRAAAATLAAAALLCAFLPGPGAPAGEPEPEPAPERLSETGLYADPERRTVDPGHLVFAPQYPLWTDGAAKRRWIALPPGTAVDASDPDAWRFPAGTRIWKEFAFDGRPVETRYMRRRADRSWLYAAYAWSADGADAVLVAPAGRRRAHPLAGGGFHAIPGVADCRACHEGHPGRVLGFSALQLSPDRDPGAPHAEPPPDGAFDLPALVRAGLVVGLPDGTAAPRIAAGSATERAALGYLHGNCGHCHNAAGPLANLGLSLRQEIGPGATPDASLATTVSVPTRRLGSDGSLRVAPGRPELSVVVERAASREPVLQMPPLGTAVADEPAVALLRAWIARMDTTETGRTTP